MSMEVAKGIVEALVPPIKAQLAPKLRKMSEEEASELVTALEKDSKPDAYTPKQWQAMRAVFEPVLEAVTGSTPQGADVVTTRTGWKGDLEPIRAALHASNCAPHGPLFWTALEPLDDPHAQVHALVRGGEVSNTVRGALPKGSGPRRQILTVLERGMNGRLVADAK